MKPIQHIEKTIPFLPLFLEEVKDAREQSLVLIEKLTRKMRWLMLGLLISSVATIVFSFFYFSFLAAFIAIIIGGLLIQQIRYTFLDKKQLNIAFQNIFITEIHTYITKSVQSSWQYDEATDFRRENLLVAQIFHPNIKLEMVSFSIVGHFEKIPIKIYKIKLKIGDENLANAHISVYDGLFMELELSSIKGKDCKTIVTPRITYQNFNKTSFHKLSLHQRGYQQYNEMDFSFNKYFKAYNMEGYDLPSSLSLVRQRQLAHFVQHHKKQVYLSFQKEKLFMAIRTDEPTLFPTLKSQRVSTEEATLNFYNDVQLCMDMLQRLQLKNITNSYHTGN